MNDTSRKPRGFAAMDPEIRSEISRLGGKTAHRNGTAHEFTPPEARSAGRKGGLEMQRRARERKAKEEEQEQKRHAGRTAKD